MGVVVEPALETTEIEVPIFDSVDESAEVGRSFPIVLINNVLVTQQSIQRLKISVELYSLPTFVVGLTDVGDKIIKTLSNDRYDTITIFLGHKDIHIKFDGHITSVTGTKSIKITGILCSKEMFDTEQKLYKDKSIVDILQEFCETTKFGLFTFDNEQLTEQRELLLNTNKRRLEFVNWLLRKYTTNLWAFDTFGYLHVGDIETMFNQPIDKYLYDVVHGDKYSSEQELIFSNDDNHELPNDKKVRIQIDAYSIQTNYGHTLFQTNKELKLLDEKETETLIETDEEIGSGSVVRNVWSGFEKHNFTYFDGVINKIMMGNFISIDLKHPCYEIVPFSVVGLELFQSIDNVTDNDITNKQKALDKEHSGKHLVVGYSYNYNANNHQQDTGNVTQRIEMI